MKQEKTKKFYNDTIKKYDGLIRKKAHSISHSYAEDIAQDIRIFLYKYLQRYDGSIELDLFVKKFISIAHKRMIFDVKKQEQFERSIVVQIDDNWDSIEIQHDNFDELVEKISSKLSLKGKIVFYAILSSREGTSYKAISKLLMINYDTFQAHLHKIRGITLEILK